jgi:hypothetical protein
MDIIPRYLREERFSSLSCIEYAAVEASTESASIGSAVQSL